VSTDHGLSFDGESLERLSELVRQLHSMDGPVAEEFFAMIVGELKRLARARLRRESPNHTLQTTDLLDQAVLNLFSGSPVQFRTLGHFMAVATRAMSRALVDHARAHHALKRLPADKRLPFDEFIESYARHDVTAERVHDAIEALRVCRPESAWLVLQLHHFAGLTWEEIAAVTEMSVPGVRAAWAVARDYLRQALG